MPRSSLKPLERNKNLEIELLRAVAILLVLYQHLGALFGARSEKVGTFLDAVQGWSGVDLFLCISGYVVSRSLIEQLGAHQTEGRGDRFWQVIKAFWVRRAFRLFPSAWLWACLVLVWSLVLPGFGVAKQNVLALLSIVTFTANFTLQQGILEPVLNPYWSRSLEEQFYFLLPAFLFFVRGQARWKLLTVCILTQFFIPRSGLILALRLDSIMWGVLIYLLTSREGAPATAGHAAPRWQALMLNAALFGLLVYVTSQKSFVAGQIGLISLISAALVYLATREQDYILPIGKGRQALYWVGSRSYTIYLVHMPIYFFTSMVWSTSMRLAGLPNDAALAPLFLALSLTLIGGVSEINFRYVESPLRDRGRQIAARLSSA